MSLRSFRQTAAALCLTAALAVPAHAMPERSAEPSGILSWLSQVWTTVWEEVTGDEGNIDPDEKPTSTPGGDDDEGHMIDPDG